ncbi:MAG: hypothetical protein H2212_12765 [Ruminococcus sp.]|nr:hypothetical protein [Ruminococcus sp.]
MWLVYLQWVIGNQIEPCAIAKSEEDAKGYIAEVMEGKQYSGLGVYKIKELPLV